MKNWLRSFGLFLVVTLTDLVAFHEQAVTVQFFSRFFCDGRSGGDFVVGLE